MSLCILILIKRTFFVIGIFTGCGRYVKILESVEPCFNNDGDKLKRRRRRKKKKEKKKKVGWGGSGGGGFLERPSTTQVGAQGALQ